MSEDQIETKAPDATVDVVEGGVKTRRGPKARVKEAAPTDVVKMRVLKKGAGRISKGVHEGGVGDDFFDAGDFFYVPAESVEALEDRGLAEAVD